MAADPPGAGVLPGKAALLGGGVIGGGWAARLLLSGVDVALYDPAPGALAVVEQQLERARRAWARLSDVAPPAPGTLVAAATVEDAVAGAGLVQESAPEREDVKRALLAQASAAAPPDALIASSTSGLLPSRIAADVRGPERFLVAHPFNPVYLLPLVELCGGEATAPQTLERAGALYRALGMHPLLVRHEVDGFIADRLLEALWREALWLVADGVATVSEVDDAIRFGAGLRWAAMGTFLTYRLAGGEAGMRHFLEQFGPALALPWTKLTEVPELDDALIERIVAQSDAQAEGLSVEQLAARRDDCLVTVLRGLRAEGWGAGLDVAVTEQAWRTRGGEVAWTVTPDWIDYNGHMTEHRYLEVLAGATDRFLEAIGAGPDYVRTAGGSYYTVESHLRHLGQARLDDRLTVDTRLLSHDAKRLHLFHELRVAGGDDPIATGEHLLIHVNAAAGRSAPAGDAVLAALSAIAGADSGRPAPEGAGRAVGTR